MQHAVVLDAGSTSTKLNLYEWIDNPFRTNAQVKQIADSRVKPGISSFIDKPFEAYKKLEEPLQTLIANLSVEERKKTPVYLAATAGMRLQLLEDPLGSLDLFDKLRRGLLTSGLLVEVPNERIRLLSGSEEGLFGWISVNNILQLITVDVQVSSDRTVGSLDLGGASTQIAFVPSPIPTTLEKTADMFPLKLFGGQYDVYSHSFLCYGKNEAERRVMGAAIGSSQATVIEHPCLLNGYVSGEMDATKIFSGPCMSGSYANKVFGKEYTKPPQLNKFQFRGTGNLATCKKLISEQFKKDSCTIPPCSFNNVFQPPVVGDFR
ncbi:apyrase, partial [Clonorchis sinensis]